MKRILKAVLPVLLLAVLLSSISFGETTALTLNRKKKNLRPGGSFQLELTGDIGGTRVRWSTSDETIAAVDQKGLVTGLHEGSADITATAGKRSAVCKVKVVLRGYCLIDGDHYYYLQDGSMAKSRWVKADGSWKWFQDNGKEIVPTRSIAFTFDDGPTANTAKVLEILKAYGQSGTFFQCGYEVAGQAAVEKEIWEAGSEIGNHSWDHPYLGRSSADTIVSQISRTNAVILKYSGKSPTLVRPPYGSVSATLRAYAKAPLILWSITDEGLYAHSGMMTANAILRNPKDGDIALMHDLHPWCLVTIRYAIPRLIQRGFQIVSVSKLAEIQGVTLKNGVEYHSIQRSGA